MKKSKHLVLGLAALVTMGGVLASCDGKTDTSTETSEKTVESSSTEENNADFIFKLSEDGKSYKVALFRSSSTSTEVEIPATYNGLPVTSIGETAFTNGSKITKLTIAESITSIESGALKGCDILKELVAPFFGASATDAESTFGYLYGESGKLQSLHVPETIETITLTKQEVFPTSSFEGLNFIKKITLQNAKDIKTRSFYDMDGLETVVLNDGITELPSEAFSSLPALKEIGLPNTLVTYNNSISSTGLTKITFPASVQEITNRNENRYIEEYAVSENSQYFTTKDGVLFTKDMTEVVSFPTNKLDFLGYRIPDTVTKIGNNAFMYSDFSIVDLNNVITIGDEAFRYSRLEKVTFPGSVTSIGMTAFSGCSRLAEVTFADALDEGTVLSLGKFTFSSSPKITTMVVPSYVESIPDYFAAGTGLTNIKIKGSLKYLGASAFGSTQIENLEVTFKDNATIGERVFSYCASLNNFYVHFVDGVTTYPTLEGNGFGNGSEVPYIICDSAEIATALKAKWTQKAYYISNELPSSYFDIDADGTTLNSFKDNNATYVEIPYGITKIGALAFSGKSKVRTLVIPETVTSIATNAFQGTTSLMDVVFEGDNLDEITAFTRLVDNSSETGYKEEAATFSKITFGGHPTFLVKNEEEKENLCSVIYESVKDDVMLSSDVTVHNDDGYMISADGKTLIRAIVGSSGEFDIPSTVENIGSRCFEDSKLSTVDLTGIKKIGDEAFCNSKLEEVTIPSTVTEIGKSAFSGVDDGESLKSVTIENAAVSIGDYAFADNCNALESINLGNAVTSLGDKVFANDEQMTEITLPASLTHIGSYCFEDSTDYITTINCCFSEEDVATKYANDDPDYETFMDFLSDNGSDVTVNFNYQKKLNRSSI